jgi:precorrin-3B synthase
MHRLMMAGGEEAIFAEAGLTAASAPARLTPEAKSTIGLISLKDQERSAFGVGLPFGRIEAKALQALADISERCGDGGLRTTPWRALLLTGIAASDATRLGEGVTALGLIADHTDSRRNIFACVGVPSCLSATVDARGDANRLAAFCATQNETLHVSGCSKSCAHRGPASLTLVGRAVRASQVSPSIRSKPCFKP